MHRPLAAALLSCCRQVRIIQQTTMHLDHLLAASYTVLHCPAPFRKTLMVAEGQLRRRLLAEATTAERLRVQPVVLLKRGCELREKVGRLVENPLLFSLPEYLWAIMGCGFIFVGGAAVADGLHEPATASEHRLDERRIGATESRRRGLEEGRDLGAAGAASRRSFVSCDCCWRSDD